MDRLVGIFGVLFASAIAYRVFVVYRESGQFPITLKNGDAAHDFIHRVIGAIIALQALNIILFRLQALRDVNVGLPVHDVYSYLHPLPAFQRPIYQALGLGLCFGGLLWTVICQHQMGKDWRVGYSTTGDDTNLVTRGLYAHIRHPIYTGFMIIACGLFLATPNVLTLVLAVLTIIILSIEARLEEAHLLTCHGTQYQDYLAGTRRWI